MNGRRPPVHLDVRAHAIQLGDVHESVFEDRLRDSAGAVCEAHEHHQLRLHVGREARVRLRDKVRRTDDLRPHHADTVSLALDRRPGLTKLGDHRLERLEADPLYQHVALGCRRRHHEGARLDAVGNDGVVDGVERIDTFDRDNRGAGTLDARAHLVENPRKLFHLRLPSAVRERRTAFRQHGSAHQVLGPRMRREVERHVGALQTSSSNGDFDVSVVQLDVRTHGLEALQVLIDRPCTDRAAARQRHDRLAASRDERTEHENGRAHLLHELVRRGRIDLARGEHPDATCLERRLGPQLSEEPGHGVNVSQVGYVAKYVLALGEKRRGHDRERGVFRAADRHGAREAVPPDDFDRIHAALLPRGSGSGNFRQRADPMRTW